MRTLALLIGLTLITVSVSATHTLGGEIRYTHVSGSTYEVEIHHYTKLISPPDHPELVVYINGNANDTLELDSFEDIEDVLMCSGGAVRINYFKKKVLFPGPGMYVITYEEQNRNGGIINIPNSLAQSFCVSATLVISPTLGHNNSVVFENPQYIIDPYYHLGANNWFFGHSLAPFDADGDSLSFEAVPAFGIGCQAVGGYSFLGPQFTVDMATGEWQWVATQIGEFNVAIRATEWRNGQMIGQVTRDMTVCVLPMVGINETSKPSFTISPTLTDGPVRINSDQTVAQPMTVLDAAGRLVMELLLQPGKQWVDLSGLGNGLYLFRMQEPDGSQNSTRVIKY